MIFFDISKAFDTVPHSTLLNKLFNNFGIGLVGKLHAWIKAFLCDRTQCVKIASNTISQSSKVTSGVIQGSILGPILYAAYTNNTVKSFKYGTPILYADDLKVVFPINRSDVRQSYDLIMHDLNLILHMNEHCKMLFNALILLVQVFYVHLLVVILFSWFMHSFSQLLDL